MMHLVYKDTQKTPPFQQHRFIKKNCDIQNTYPRSTGNKMFSQRNITMSLPMFVKEKSNIFQVHIRLWLLN